MLTRRGLTLVETLVAMTIAGVALGIVGTISLRQQRLFTELGERGALSNQLNEAAAMVPIDLRSLAPALGDVRDARDTVMEFRATIASAVVCDTANGSILLPAASTSSTDAAYGSYASTVEVGDTLWWFAAQLPDAPSEQWAAARVTAVGSSAPGTCGAGAPAIAAGPRVSIGLSPTPDAGIIGAPIRITRPFRMSLYRASDGGWYIGQRDWNNTLARFNAIQPVAGPFLTAASGGLRFLYADSLGASLANPAADARAIALVRVEIRGQTRPATAGPIPRRTDSVKLAVAFPNRR